MRISLLLEREPFGDIVAQTLADFWTVAHDRPYQVQWQATRRQATRRQAPRRQTWFVNPWLNAIFTPQLQTTAFDPIRREFGRSLTWWRRPIQKTYVACATQGPAACWLSPYRLQVQPAVPRANSTLIIPGNRKLRILDHQAKTCHSIVKSGFDGGIQTEIESRQLAERLGLPVPKLIAQDVDKQWYSEQYVSATPLNRLTDRQLVVKSCRQAIAAMLRLMEATSESACAADYVTELAADIHRLLATIEYLKHDLRVSIAQSADQLVEQASNWRHELTTTLAHGDFQPANVLVNNEGVWIIDWEQLSRRQLGYDLLVFALSSRQPEGLAGRLASYVYRDCLDDRLLSNSSWPVICTWTRAEKLRRAALFLLEELWWRVHENAQPPVHRVLGSLRMIHGEIQRWNTNEHR